jgi:SpoVK/Ycf46/Vps4 family AAA+-type ATPase
MHRVDAIDPALRRYGRFDIETEVTVPNEKERLQILEVTVRDTIFGPSPIFGFRSFSMI